VFLVLCLGGDRLREEGLAQGLGLLLFRELV